jgi:peptidoglycan DL-endopeptidase RipA
MWERTISQCRHWTVVGLIGCALGGFGLNGATGLATANPDPNDIATLVAAVADAEQQLHDVGADIQERQEGVNKAIAEVQSARDQEAAAVRDVAAGQQGVADANAAIATEQGNFDRFAVASYVNGPSASYLTARGPEDVVATASAGQTLNLSFAQSLAALRGARTEQANRESAARAVEKRADDAVVAAQRAQDTAVAELTDARKDFDNEQGRVDQIVAQRDAARARLNDAQKALSGEIPATAASGRSQSADWDRAPMGPATAEASQWDTTLPMVPSADISGDPVAVVNTVLRVSATSAQLTADLGRSFLSKLGINLGGDGVPGGFTNGAIPRVYGRQASEYAIQRAMSQIGVPYSWGGGNAAGPSRGIDSGAGTVGFDCSGIVLYAFAGVGIKLPHYSGDQYNSGRKIPSSQMRRGDVIFYGPNASQHEALYLGQGMMLESPYTGSDVHISRVRTSGMTPYVTRFIEY